MDFTSPSSIIRSLRFRIKNDEDIEQLGIIIDRGDFVSQFNPDAIFELFQFLDILTQKPRWEKIATAIYLEMTLLDHFDLLDDAQFVKLGINQCQRLVDHSEPRVREKVASFLGLLSKTKSRDAMDYALTTLLARLLDLIRICSVREVDEMDRTSTKVLDDTTGWRSLESSLICTRELIDGCGLDILNHVVFDELCDLVLSKPIHHPNRHVRQVCMTLCTSFNRNYPSASRSISLSCIVVGLNDDWSQVRHEASKAARYWWMCHPDKQDDELRSLVPIMMMNRFYLAEGVSNYSNETWRQINLNWSNLKQSIVEFYINQSKRHNHVVQETAYKAMIEVNDEIAVRIVLMEGLTDDCWAVTDAAIVSISPIVRNQIEVDVDVRRALLQLINHPMSIIRHHVSLALGGDKGNMEFVDEHLLDGVAHVEEQVEVDDEEHTNQTMFSCGSLSSSTLLKRKPWMMSDGCIRLLSTSLEWLKASQARRTLNAIKLLLSSSSCHFQLQDTIYTNMPIFLSLAGDGFDDLRCIVLNSLQSCTRQELKKKITACVALLS